jgi:hypothetical protein
VPPAAAAAQDHARGCTGVMATSHCPQKPRHRLNRSVTCQERTGQDPAKRGSPKPPDLISGSGRTVIGASNGPGLATLDSRSCNTSRLSRPGKPGQASRSRPPLRNGDGPSTSAVPHADVLHRRRGTACDVGRGSPASTRPVPGSSWRWNDMAGPA